MRSLIYKKDGTNANGTVSKTMIAEKQQQMNKPKINAELKWLSNKN